jgi:hypothetical protein
VPRTKTKTTKVRYHPVIKLPPLSPDQYEGLRANVAVNGVLVPIFVDSNGPRRNIIDGNYRKQLADEFGYACPEIVLSNLEDEEKRTLARALNLARRQLNTEQKRAIIADQLGETPGWTNRRVAKMLGVSHPTVASVRAELESSGKIFHHPTRECSDGRLQPASKIAYSSFVCNVPQLDRTLDEKPEVERYSPPWIVEAARKVMGAIDVDPASCERANKVVKATKFFSQKNNGLRQHWRGRVFLNPPFGHEWRAWAVKLMEEIEAGRTKQAFLVAPGAVLWVVAAPWFRPLLRGSLFLPDERIEYLNPRSNAWQDVCLGSFCVYYGPQQKRFAKVFGSKGAILRQHLDCG